MKDIRSILRLTFEQGLSIRAVSERLKLSKTSVSTYLLRAREAGLAVWPLPPGLDADDILEQRLFRREVALRQLAKDAIKLMETRWSEIEPAAFRNKERELETVSNCWKLATFRRAGNWSLVSVFQRDTGWVITGLNRGPAD
ncbi:transposase [Ensifer adhaerens]|uniref:Transposase n=1 Tax=Ensifer adhaerens TaxID=106592 RepID=A0ACC5SU36_ENSAD|nr:transposase [Ensifer adhaerens]